MSGFGKKRAVFLDRDGVLNGAVVRDGKPYPPANEHELEILPGVPEALLLLRQHGYVNVVVTNQPDVGRGTTPVEVVERIHGRMTRELALDVIKVCYDDGKTVSTERRKPRPGMLLEAAEELGIDLAGSFMVGDRWRDVDAGHHAGCRTIFIDYSYDEPLRMQPHFRVNTLLEAANLIVSLDKSTK